MAKLERPRGLTINFKPSERQYELWNALQPNRCDKCGGSLEMRPSGHDAKGHVVYQATCVNCGNTDIPEQILGGGSAGGGKAMSLNSLILTPYGFKNVQSVSVGEEIISASTGKKQTITAIHPMGEFEFYRINFEDGSEVECSEGHLWNVCESEYGPYKTLEARQISQWYKNRPYGFGGFQKGFMYIPTCAPVEFDVVEDTEQDYYLKGCIYGSDGNNGTIVCIPTQYRYASVDARKKFLNGLLTTAGHQNIVRDFSFVTPHKQFADDLLWLLRSLGHVARTIEVCGKYSVIGNLNKKTKRIDGIKKIGKQKSFCISVSEPDGLYVIDDFTVTHNSFLGCCWLTYSCMQFPGIRMVVARKVRKTLLETTWRTLHDVLTSWGLKEDVNYHINNQTYTVTFWNGSTIMALELTAQPSDPDFNSLGSLEITGAFVDEVSEVSEKAIEVLASRIRYKIEDTFVVGKIFLSSNPALTWIRSTFVMDDDGNPAILQPGYRYIPFSLFDNPNENFRRIYYNKLSKIRDKATRDRLLYGNWWFVEGNKMAAYWNFDGEKALKQQLYELRYDPLKPLILSFDFNVNPYMTCLPMQVDYENKTFYVFPEFIGRSKDKLNNTPSFSRWIAKSLVEWGHAGGVLVTGDPAGLARSTQTEEGVNNFTIVMKNLEAQKLRPKLQLLSKQPAQTTRLEFVNELFSGYSGWSIQIDIKCRRLTEDFVYQKKNPDGTKEKKKVVMDSGERAERYGHASDCFDYALVYYLGDEYTRYRTSNTDIVTTIGADEMVYGEFDY